MRHAQQRALEAQTNALKDLKNRVETLCKEEAVVEIKAAEAERLAEKAVKKAQEAKAEADRAHREAIAVDVEKEADRHRTKGQHFHIPDSKTVVTLSGYAKVDVIHDFQKKSTLWVAVEDPNYSIENGKTKSAWPDTIVSLNWHGDGGHLKPALMGRQLQGDNDDDGDDDTEFG